MSNQSYLIDATLTSVKQMTLTTLDPLNIPYSVIVYFLHRATFDLPGSFLKIYWISTPKREHSIHLQTNSNVSLAVAKEFVPGDKPTALFLNGTAKPVQDKDETAQVWELMKTKIAPFFKDNFLSTHILYRADISKIRIWDETGKVEGMRQVIDISINEQFRF